MKAVRAGLFDAVQVIYNIFDQNPEDELFPACREKDVAVIARVPFDEGTLTGTLTLRQQMACGRLAEYVFRAGKFEEQRRARRQTQATAERWNDDARDGDALHPQQSGS